MHRTTSAAIQGQLGVVNSRVAVPARVATSLAHLRAAPSSRRADRRGPVQTVAWGGLKKLGLQKPSWLPDFGASKRKQLLLTFFSGIDRQRYEDLLAPDFLQVEEGMRHIKSYGREDFMNLMCNCIAPAIPDWNWTPATDGIVDDEGFALVTVQATGHHSGGTLNFPTLPPVPASGKRFKLPPSLLKVKVEEGQIKEIVALKGDKSGLMALYDTLAGEGRGVSNASNSVTGSKKA